MVDTSSPLASLSFKEDIVLVGLCRYLLPGGEE